MNIEFEKHIIELLKNNQCVILPGFGGFLLKSIPSSIHQNTIFPPSKQIAFNNSLIHDDELLTGAIMGAYALNYQVAKNKVLTFANHINYTLKKEQQFSLKQIGAFTVGENNQIIFKPFLNTVVDKDAFGLNKFHIKPISKPVIASKKATTTIKEPQLVKQKQARKATTRKTSKLPVLGLVSSVLLMAGVIGLVATNTSIAPDNVQQAGFVDMLFPNDTFIPSFGNKTEMYTESNSTPSAQKEGYKTGGLLTFNRKDLAEGYYLVLGSYSSLANAERMEASLFASGKDSYILPSDNGFYRVCAFANTNYLEAKQSIEASNKNGAWLLKNRHSI